MDPGRSAISIGLAKELPGRISREDLRGLATEVARPNLADQDRDDACLRLWVGTRIWGGGSRDGRVPWNTRNSLLVENLEKELADSRDAFLEGKPFDIPDVKGAGLPYTSKWLWALGTAQRGWAPTGPQAYILDRRVRSTLGWLASCKLDPEADRALGTPRDPGAYVAYCTLLEDAAAKIQATQQSHIDAEKIEWLLFSGADGEYPSFLSRVQ